MATEREQATAEFRRIMKWIIAIGAVMAIGAIAYYAGVPVLLALRYLAP